MFKTRLDFASSSIPLRIIIYMFVDMRIRIRYKFVSYFYRCFGKKGSLFLVSQLVSRMCLDTLAAFVVSQQIVKQSTAMNGKENIATGCPHRQNYAASGEN